MAKAPDTILQLVENFGQNLESFKSQRYNETQLRREFIDPFFEALGWDVTNKSGTAQAYKDVIHEDAIRVGSATKAPDYCFRIGGTRKFFLEAKKPSVDIKGDAHPAYQLRRYAWSAKLPLSILTDFEEFAVYDCLTKPSQFDKASTSRIMLIRYSEYPDKWEQIAEIFSKDAVLKGSFDKFAASAKGKRGTSTVDAEFLAEIESWRDTLAKNIAIRNSKLSVYDLNFAVQKTIDRILFLRMCEDRRIEPYGQLQGLVNGSRIYPRLFGVFERADEKYNSGIFHFRREKDRPESPDEISANLKVDDDVLAKILKDLYYPQSPYEFSVLSAEILGNVYEQFLGKVIRLTASHQAKVEEKPEVKKAGGVYYTPSYIVDYIVKNTIGKLCDGKTPKQIEKIKILDPACGSGSFLIGAYQYLLDFHRDYYAKEPSKHKKAIYQGKGGLWFLTIAEKKRILLNNIFGVDIDSQAAEVTKLSLLLKVLENETQESLRLFHERALPDLGDNIKCGNSLIGPDFYKNQQLSLFDDDQKRKVNAFDWQAEFSEVFKAGGFDCVIGNPPWGAEFIKEERDYLVRHFSVVATKTKDSYLYFVSHAIEILRKSGFLGYIIPNTWLLINNAREYRREILSLKIDQIVDHGDGVFKKAIVESCTLLLQNNNDLKGSCRAIRYRKGEKVIDHVISKAIWFNDDLCRIIIDMDSKTQQIIKKLHNRSQKFEQSCFIIWGIKPYQVGYGIPPQTKDMLDKRVYHSTVKLGNEWKPLLVGKDVDRYKIKFSGNQYIKYGEWLMYPSNEKLMTQPKILLRQTSDIVRASYDTKNFYCQNSLFIVHSEKINLLYLLGLLNSKLLSFVYKLNNPQKGKVFAEIKPSVIKSLPICICNLDDNEHKAKHGKMVSLVEQMLELHKKLSKIKNPEEKTRIQRQIEATDSQIDKLVYELYGLTEDEIKIVEGENKIKWSKEKAIIKK